MGGNKQLGPVRDIDASCEYTTVSNSPSGYISMLPTARRFPPNSLKQGTVVRLKGGCVISSAESDIYLIGWLSDKPTQEYPSSAYFYRQLFGTGGMLPSQAVSNCHVLADLEIHIGPVSGGPRLVNLSGRISLFAGETSLLATEEIFGLGYSMDTTIARWPHLAVDVSSEGWLTRVMSLVDWRENRL